MDALKVGVLRSITSLHQRLEAQLHQLHHAAAEDSLLAEEVGFRLVLEGGLHHAAAGPADASRVSQSQVQSLAGGILLHGYQAGHAFAVDVGRTDGVAGSLGSDHAHVHAGGGHDLLEMDVEAMGEHQHIALFQIGGDILLVNVRLYLVVHQNHDDVGPFRGISHGLDLQARLFRVGPVLGARAQTTAHIAAGFLQIQRMGVALGAIANDADFLPVQLSQIAVLLIIHSCHIRIPPSVCSRHISCYALSRWR